MGLYDEIRIRFDVSKWIPNFPIEDEALKTLSYQTKSLQNILDHYEIDQYCTLLDSGSSFFKTNVAEKTIASTKYTLYDGSTITFPYNGIVTFYSSNEEYSFIEFLAVFNKAKIESLHCLILEKRIVDK